MSRSTASIASMLTLVLMAPVFPGVASAADHIRIQGRVLDENGEGIADWPVTLIGTQRTLEFKRFSSGGDVQTVASVTTDRSGYFSIDAEKKRGLQYWFLRFVSLDAFDPVKYLPPQDIEITKDARKGRLVEASTTVRFHPDWSEVLRRVTELGGGGTPKGEILLTLGLPEKIVTEDPGVEEWWYFEHGVVYTFNGAEEMSTRRFEAVRPPSESGGSGTEGR